MDVDPDTVAAVAVEGWIIARAAALVAMHGTGHEAAVAQAMVDLRRRYPQLGGTLRGRAAKDFLA